MNTTTATAKPKKSTWSPIDAWGTPEHDAAIAKMRKGHECKHRQCPHLITDKQMADIRKGWY